MGYSPWDCKELGATKHSTYLILLLIKFFLAMPLGLWELSSLARIQTYDGTTICSHFGAQENKVSDCFPIYLHEVMGPDDMILVF